MKHLRALLAVAFAVAGTAACGTAEPDAAGTAPPAVASSAPPSPKDTLVSAAKALDAASFSLRISQDGMAGTGRFDGPAKAMAFEVNTKVQGQKVSFGYLVIAPNVWFKGDLGTAANKSLGITKGKWMLIDQTKVESKDAFPIDDTGNPSLALAPMFEAASGVVKTDAGHFEGKLDVSVANKLFSADAEVLQKIGDKAKSVPFTAAVDEQGRLKTLKLDGTGIDPSISTEAEFTDFGAIQPITKPAGAYPAPASVYKMLNG
ncbi:hypothetical protein AB0M46_25540 [Dactylosporangium sp. NPDC051485]|uniref:hypothetical protein n=1 Tax=Dactylosporangium sp. NPDC051485 TaxID=3154846 RepID=UPI00341EBBA4